MALPLNEGSHQYIKEQIIIEAKHLPTRLGARLVWQSADWMDGGPIRQYSRGRAMASVGALEIMMINGIKNGDFRFIILYKPESCTLGL